MMSRLKRREKREDGLLLTRNKLLERSLARTFDWINRCLNNIDLSFAVILQMCICVAKKGRRRFLACGGLLIVYVEVSKNKIHIRTTNKH